MYFKSCVLLSVVCLVAVPAFGAPRAAIPSIDPIRANTRMKAWLEGNRRQQLESTQKAEVFHGFTFKDRLEYSGALRTYRQAIRCILYVATCKDSAVHAHDRGADREMAVGTVGLLAHGSGEPHQLGADGVGNHDQGP